MRSLLRIFLLACNIIYTFNIYAFCDTPSEMETEACKRYYEEAARVNQFRDVIRKSSGLKDDHGRDLSSYATYQITELEDKGCFFRSRFSESCR